MKKATHCKHCGKPIIPQRKNKIFCSASCRAADHNQNKWIAEWIKTTVVRYKNHKYKHTVVIDTKNISISLKDMPKSMRNKWLPVITDDIKMGNNGTLYKNGSSIIYESDKTNLIELIRSDEGMFLVRW